jgi:Flp pilus assembly protein TadG
MTPVISPSPSLMARGPGGEARSRGQALVEFALVIPVFLLLLFGLIELSLIAGAVALFHRGVEQAARTASLAGMSESGIDRQTVRSLEAYVQAYFPAHVVQVEIFRSNAQGDGPNPDADNVFDAQDNPVGSPTWPVASRQSTVDAPIYLGVRITFQYFWVTSFVGAIGAPLTLQETAVMPILPVGG